MNKDISDILHEALSLLNNNKFNAAIEIYQYGILQFPKSPQLYHAYGVALIAKNEPILAIEKFHQALKLDPQNPNYNSDLGEMYRRINKLDLSIEFNLKGVKLSPDSDNTQYNLGLAYLDNKNIEKAILHFEKTIKINPKHGFALNNLGSAFLKLGNKKQSLDFYQKALDVNPENIEALKNLGAMYLDINKIDQAINTFNKIIKLSPFDFDAHHALTQFKTYTKDDPGLQLLKDLPKHNQLSKKEATYYHFDYGKALDDLGEYDEAFYYYEKANTMINQLMPKNINVKEYANKLKNLYNSDYINKLKPKILSNNLKLIPIFIVGMPRSGTTLIEQILDMNSNIYGAGEIATLNECIKKNITHEETKNELNSFATNLLKPQESLCYENISNDYLNKIYELSPEHNFIINKSPGNYNHLGLIYLSMPNAKIIHAVRDPMESCFSNFTKFFADYKYYNYSLEDLGIYYKYYHLLMQHWKAVLPKNFICDVPYEDLVNKIEKESKRMTDFIGVEWEPSSLKFYENKRTVTTPSKMQVNKPIYNTSIARWKKFAKHLKPLYEIVKPYRTYDPEIDEFYKNLK